MGQNGNFELSSWRNPFESTPWIQSIDKLWKRVEGIKRIGKGRLLGEEMGRVERGRNMRRKWAKVVHQDNEATEIGFPNTEGVIGVWVEGGRAVADGGTDLRGEEFLAQIRSFDSCHFAVRKAMGIVREWWGKHTRTGLSNHVAKEGKEGHEARFFLGLFRVGDRIALDDTMCVSTFKISTFYNHYPDTIYADPKFDFPTIDFGVLIGSLMPNDQWESKKNILVT